MFSAMSAGRNYTIILLYEYMKWYEHSSCVWGNNVEYVNSASHPLVYKKQEVGQQVSLPCVADARPPDKVTLCSLYWQYLACFHSTQIPASLFWYFSRFQRPICVHTSRHVASQQDIYIYIYIYQGWGFSHGNYFFSHI